MLDEDEVTPPDRLRLLILYLLFRDGLLPADLQKLLSHANLPPQDTQIITNLSLLGARTTRNLKDSRPAPQPMFPRKPPPMQGGQEEYLLSRYEPVLQQLLKAHATNSVDPTTFPYTKPPLDLDSAQQPAAATSLRTGAKPTWAKTTRGNAVSAENRQRVILFMAGGATFSESRAAYDVGRSTGREVFLTTSHMLTPQLFIRQVGDLSADKKRLGIPAEGPKEQAPSHLFEPDEQPKPPPTQVPPQAQQRTAPSGPRPPEQAMAGMNLNGRPNGTTEGGRQGGPIQLGSSQQSANTSAKLSKEPGREKKRHLLGFGKKDKY